MNYSANLIAAIARMRSADVTSANAATPFARAALDALLNGGATLGDIEAGLLLAYKVKGTGKRAPNVAGLRKVAGGNNAAERLRQVKFIFEERAKMGDTLGDFVAKANHAPQTLAALHDAAKAAVKAKAQADADAAGEDADATPDADGNAPVNPLCAALAAATSMVDALTADDVNLYGSELILLMNAVRAASTRTATVTVAIAA